MDLIGFDVRVSFSKMIGIKMCSFIQFCANFKDRWFVQKNSK